MDKSLHLLQSVKLNYFSIPKLQQWSPWIFGMDKWLIKINLY